MSTLLAALALGISLFSFLYLRKLTRHIPPEWERELAGRAAEIERLTDRDCTLVEERVKQLKTFLADADKRVNLYTQELEKLKLENLPKTKAPPPPASGAPTPAPYSLFAPPPSPPALSDLGTKERIAALARSGLSAAAISEKLGLVRTEVELALFMSAENAHH